MSAPTAGIAAIEEHLDSRFPGMRFGRYSGRPIGKRVWESPDDPPSQHGFSNARDLWHPSPTATQVEINDFLDEVAAYLNEHRKTLAIRTLLWQVEDHFDHIHIDIFPTGLGHPFSSPWGPDTPAGHRWHTLSGNEILGASPPWDGELPRTGGIDVDIISDDTWLTMGRHFPDEDWTYYTSRGDAHGGHATREEKEHAFNLWVQRMSRALEPSR